jgi:hypothetical protein
MIATYLKHLQKLNDSEQESEVGCFRKFILKNPNICDRQLTDTYYYGTKPASPIFFGNLFALGSTELVDEFWTKITGIERSLFVNGRPEPEPVSESTDGSGAIGGSSTAASVMAVLESNPIFSDVIDQVKSTVSSMDVNDIGSLLESKDFNKLVKNIKSGLTSGKYKMSDLTGTINAVIGSVQNELDPETRNTLSTAASMVSAAERGEQPDVQKLMGMIQTLKFN